MFIQTNWIPGDLHLTPVDTPNTWAPVCHASSGGALHCASKTSPCRRGSREERFILVT